MDVKAIKMHSSSSWHTMSASTFSFSVLFTSVLDCSSKPVPNRSFPVDIVHKRSLAVDILVVTLSTVVIVYTANSTFSTLGS